MGDHRAMAEFALPLINLMVRLRKAETENTGCDLAAGEVKVLLDAMRLLKDGPA